MAVPRLHKETSIFDPDSTIAGGIDEAKGKAENYITDVSNAGIWVTPSDAKPDDDTHQPIARTRGWHIADALEYFRGTVRYIKAWINGTTPTVRLGQDSSGHADVTPSGLDVYTDATTNVAHFGSTVELYGGSSYPKTVVDSTGTKIYHDSASYITAGHGTLTGMLMALHENGLEQGVYFTSQWSCEALSFYRSDSSWFRRVECSTDGAMKLSGNSDVSSAQWATEFGAGGFSFNAVPSGASSSFSPPQITFSASVAPSSISNELLFHHPTDIYLDGHIKNTSGTKLYADASHTHPASDVTGVLSKSHGGTGITNAGTWDSSNSGANGTASAVEWKQRTSKLVPAGRGIIVGTMCITTGATAGTALQWVTTNTQSQAATADPSASTNVVCLSLAHSEGANVPVICHSIMPYDFESDTTVYQHWKPISTATTVRWSQLFYMPIGAH